MNWDQIVRKAKSYIVKIETPSGHGTGFLCMYNETKLLCGIATADHVIAHEDDWQEPIKIRHEESGKVTLLKEGDRVIYRDSYNDSAMILFLASKLPLPATPIPLLPPSTKIDIGVEVGWLGYPGIAHNTICFFSGNVSAAQENQNAYLIDGVAINGVSGGPVLYSTDAEGLQIVGTVSAYRANRATGDALPGLLISQDVTHFHDVISKIKSIDDAKKEKEQKDDQKS